jgi:hypothetical protein
MGQPETIAQPLRNAPANGNQELRGLLAKSVSTAYNLLIKSPKPVEIFYLDLHCITVHPWQNIWVLLGDTVPLAVSTHIYFIQTLWCSWLLSPNHFAISNWIAGP